jgi:hypothetical protein
MRLLFIFFAATTFFQDELILDAKKYEACRIDLPVAYRNTRKELRLAEKLKDKELIVFRTQSDRTIIESTRGFLKVSESNSTRIIYFIPSDSRSFVASFPELEGENIFCYDAKCFDSLR